MIMYNTAKSSREEVKYSLDWSTRTKVAQPPFYKRPALFMLVCTVKKSK